MQQQLTERLRLEQDLRHAMRRNEFMLYYQPQVDMRSRRVIGVEALVRWQHPKYGVVPPMEFIIPAEQSGVIKPLTLWVFNSALNVCLDWKQFGVELPVSINLSARNLHDPQLPDQLSHILQQCGGPANLLELEITESAIMFDPVRALEAVTRIKRLGIRIAIDDFGTGHSSLSYLSNLPVDTIKIDRSFVGNMARENNAVIVRSTVDLAHNLGLKAVAEGVEDQEAWDRLVAMGCDAAQGYYMCKPIPADELTRWLRESPWGLKNMRELIRKLQIMQISCGQIDGYGKLHTGPFPVQTDIKGRFENPEGQRLDHSALLRRNNELHGRNDSVFRVLPADERLDSDHTAGSHIHQGLIVEEQLVLFNRLPQVRHQRQTAGAVLIPFGSIDRIGASRLLRRIHRHIRPLHQTVRIPPMLRTQRHSDARFCHDRQSINQKWFFQSLENFLKDPGDMTNGRQSRQQDRKLISSQPRHNVRLEQHVFQSDAYLLQ